MFWVEMIELRIITLTDIDSSNITLNIYVD